MKVLFLVALVLPATVLAQGDWPHWRGPDDNGCAGGGPFPATLKELVWKTSLPGKGFSTPVVVDKRIFLTAATNRLDAVLAFDMSGKPLWLATFGPQNPGRHRNGSGANASPATDGKSVFVYFKSGTLAALALDGKIRWQTNLVQAFGPDTLYWDHGTSPILTEKYVVMARMHEGESWLAAFDKSTGALKWKQARNFETPVEGDHSYATPLLVRHRGEETLLVWGGEHLSLHSVTDGKELWSQGGFNPEQMRNWPTVASPVVVGDIAVVPYGRADRGQPRLHGIRVTTGERLWKRDDAGTFVPTPASCEGKIYIVRDRGEVECIDPTTGKTVWNDAFGRTSKNFYASPVIADGKLYAAREDGVVFVAKIDGKFEVLSEQEVGDKLIASIVPVAGRFLIRGENHLFCVGKNEKK